MTIPTLATVTRPTARGYHCALDGILLRLAAGPQRETVLQGAELSPPKIDTASNAEEMTRGHGVAFVRNDFRGGSGLLRAHDRGLPELADMRFWDSRNIDNADRPTGELRDLRLLHATERIDTLATSTLRTAWTGSKLYVCSGTTFRVSSDPLATPAVFSDESPHAGQAATTVADVAVLGTTVYAALGTSGIHRRLAGGAWEHWSDLQADRVWAVKDRIVARGNSGLSLYEVTAAGAAPAAKLTLQAGDEITSVADAGAAIMAASTSGYIYALTLSDDPTPVLELARQTLVPGEQVVCISAAQDVVVFLTRTPTTAGAIGRLYRAALSDSFVLVDREVLYQWGDDTAASDFGAHVLVASRDAAYTVVRDGLGGAQAWRYDLVRGGVSRWWTFDVDAPCHGALIVKGQFLAAFDASGVWRQSTSYVVDEDAWLMCPYGDLFDASEKNWEASRLTAADLPTGSRIELWYSTDIEAMADPDHASWQKARTVTSGAASGEEVLRGVFARGIVGMVRLSTTDPASTPKVHSFGFEASGGDAGDMLRLVVDVGDQVEHTRRRPHRVRGRGAALYDELRDRQGRSVALVLFKPDRAYVGVVRRVSALIPAPSGRGSLTTYAVIDFRGTRAESDVPPEIGSVLGFDIIALDLLGVTP